jgi:GNAT superfamily N-acetyltransferase
VLGIVVGPLDPPRFFRRLLRQRCWSFCASTLSALLKRPLILGRLLRAVLYRGAAPAGGLQSLLSSVAVAPEARGHGIGAALVRRWVDEAHRRGAAGCYLTTDADDNGEVNRFYLREGWVLESSFATPEGRRMNRYVFNFTAATR